MPNILSMTLIGGTVALALGVYVSVTVNIDQPPPPTAEAIGHEVVSQQDESLGAARMAARERKAAMRCGLPGYAECR